MKQGYSYPIGLQDSWLRSFFQIVFIFFVAWCPCSVSTASPVTFMSGHLRLQADTVEITPEFFILDNVMPVCILRLKPLQLGSLSSKDSNGNWLSGVTVYSYGSGLFPEEMDYIRKQCRAWPCVRTAEIQTALNSGKTLRFMWITMSDGDQKLVLEPPLDTDPLMKRILQKIGTPDPLFDGIDPIGAEDIVKLTIRFHEVGQKSDLSHGYRVRIVSSNDLKEMGIDENYFAQVHSYENKEDLNNWAGVFMSGDYYLLGNRIYLADIDIELRGVADCFSQITKQINHILTTPRINCQAIGLSNQAVENQGRMKVFEQVKSE